MDKKIKINYWTLDVFWRWRYYFVEQTDSAAIPSLDEIIPFIVSLSRAFFLIASASSQVIFPFYPISAIYLSFDFFVNFIKICFCYYLLTIYICYILNQTFKLRKLRIKIIKMFLFLNLEYFAILCMLCFLSIISCIQLFPLIFQNIRTFQP